MAASPQLGQWEVGNINGKSLRTEDNNDTPNQLLAQLMQNHSQHPRRLYVDSDFQSEFIIPHRRSPTALDTSQADIDFLTPQNSNHLPNKPSLNSHASRTTRAGQHFIKQIDEQQRQHVSRSKALAGVGDQFNFNVGGVGGGGQRPGQVNFNSKTNIVGSRQQQQQ